VGNDSLNLLRLVFGHVAGIECRRALARGWLLWLRAVVGTLLAASTLFFFWAWWLAGRFDSSFTPGIELRIFLSAVSLVLLTITAVQAPAVLAGSLAGERERGILQLLLTTTLSPREIVEGRLLGKLSQVGMLILAGLPIVAFLAPLDGLGVAHLFAMSLLLAAVGFGAGGLAVGASVVSRRGRDAQLTVYILMIVLTMAPLLSWLGLPREAVDVLEWFNPYFSMNRLVWSGEVNSALYSAAFWSCFGLAGVALAIWRLRPSCLSVGVTLAKTRTRRKAPPVRERPMLWKELFIERVASLGRFGRWLGVSLTIVIGGGSLVLAAMIAYSAIFPSESLMASWARSILSVVLGGFAGTLLGWLLQWGVGLRASVSIASERERATLDALLMSPLTPREIGLSKLIGSLYALRWLAAAMLLAWTLAFAVGAVTAHSYISWVVGNLTMGAFMAAIGVRCSLSLPTATKAMSWTIALWLISWPVVSFIAISIIGVVFLAFTSSWAIAMSYGLVSPNTPPWFPISFRVGWTLVTNLTTLLFTFLVALDTSLRFDRIAGRMAGGTVATTVDAMVHGTARKAVFLPDQSPAKKAKTVAKAPVPEELAAPSASGVSA
jgi:ABC-type Na+ efflux pump permease subunit